MGPSLCRARAVAVLKEFQERWDILIVGGGATGLGAAVDAAGRGFKTLLIEQSDFGKGTSSRSTKLIHGGVRYLRSGEISLVRESLVERTRLLENAPHLVRPLPILLPTRSWWEQCYYGMGLKVYDCLAGRCGIGRSRWLSHSEVVKLIPGLGETGIQGGVLFYDAQFDDARLSLNLAQTAVDEGATVLNYTRAESFVKEGG